MPIFEFERKSPRIGSSSFINETATIIGDVSVGERCFVGAGAVLRSDYGRIEIADRTSIQENAVLHARSDDLCRVGHDV
jgi:phenylacetic acid degradation protein